jgi:hypothetical protein
MAEKMLLVHGYSDGSTSFTALRDFFRDHAGYDEVKMYFVDYTSMDDETTYRDLADKLDTDYRILFPDERIDVVCHSTGSLVVRAWLALHNERNRLRMGEDENELPPCPVERLICFAPANFGSDLALLGQSFLSKFRTTFFNNHSQAEDAFETGKVLLQGLEPASPFQWELSMYDLHDKHTYFSPDRPKHRRCYPFVLSAGTGYTGLQAKLIKQRAKPGTDGTVRIPGTSLNTRMCTLDFPDNAPPELYWYPEVKFPNIPFAVFAGFNHGSIINPEESAFFSDIGPGKMALEALKVSDDKTYETVSKQFENAMEANYNNMADDDKNKDRFQQFFFKVRDDVNLPVPDYYIDFHIVLADGTTDEELTVTFDEYFQTSFYQHSVDSSCRVMLVNCARLEEFDKLLEGKKARLMIQVNGISSLPDVKYRPQTFEVYDPTKDYDIYFLYPNTTTLVDLVLNREQSDRMLSIKDSELISIKELKMATQSGTLLGGRAGLLRE